jgi:hypothetical protein
VECLADSLEIPPAPGFEVRSFGHGERRRKARKKVAVILAIGHALGAHQALSRSDALTCFLEVVHRLFDDGGFVGHDRNIRVGILRRVGGSGYPSGCPGPHYEEEECTRRAG